MAELEWNGPTAGGRAEVRPSRAALSVNERFHCAIIQIVIRSNRKGFPAIGFCLSIANILMAGSAEFGSVSQRKEFGSGELEERGEKAGH